MGPAVQTDRQSGWRTVARLGAVVAVVFYMATAHLTRGHEADFGKQWLAARLVATGEGKRLFRRRKVHVMIITRYIKNVHTQG